MLQVGAAGIEEEDTGGKNVLNKQNLLVVHLLTEERLDRGAQLR